MVKGGRNLSGVNGGGMEERVMRIIRFSQAHSLIRLPIILVIPISSYLCAKIDLLLSLQHLCLFIFFMRGLLIVIIIMV